MNFVLAFEEFVPFAVAIDGSRAWGTSREKAPLSGRLPQAGNCHKSGMEAQKRNAIEVRP